MGEVRGPAYEAKDCRTSEVKRMLENFPSRSSHSGDSA